MTQCAPPQRFSRRRLLQIAGATAGLGAAGALAYGGYEGYSRGILVRAAEGPVREIRDHRVPAPAGAPALTIAHGPSPARNLRAALDRMGGLGSLLSSDDVVLVKPNVGFARVPIQAATTNPEVIAEVVRACREAGVTQVIVTDCPAHPAAGAFDKSGIRRAAEEAGARVILPADSRYLSVELPGGLGRWPVLEPFVTADKIINVAIAKHHGRTLATAGMKNWFGVLGGLRNELHDQIDQAVGNLALLMRPTLTVIDATRTLMHNGPSGGNLDDVKQQDALCVSFDPVAADAWAVTLVGQKPERLAWLTHAAGLGLGRADFRALAPPEIRVG